MKTGEQPTALVTGSARGLGRMAATLLAEAGWAVAVNFRRNRTAALELCKRLRDAGRKVEILQGDLTRRRDVDDLVRRVLDRFGRVDALIHAVGPFIRERRRFADYTPEEIDALIDGNFRSALHAVRAVLPPMRRQGSGRIILFGFGRAGEAPAWPDRAVYAAAKTGLVSFVKSVAVEEAPFGITVNMVCPGDIVGENKEKRIGDVSGQRDEETPRGRPGTGEDVARVIRFLCEPESDFVTGNIINVTGGLDVIHPVSKAGK